MIWTLIGLFIITIVLLHTPTVQHFIGSQTASALSGKLGADVKVGRVSIGFPNRIIIDDVSIKDQHGLQMLNATRLSAKVALLPVTQSKIVITSAQLFGVQAFLSQETPDKPFNFQFVLDSLASEDSTSRQPIDLKINSLVIRHGKVSFDKHYTAKTPGCFSPNHIQANDVSAHIILNTLQNDSINLKVKRLSLKEASGLAIKNLTFKVLANRERADLQDFEIELPNSIIKLDDFTATYRHENDKFIPATLQYKGGVASSVITYSDLRPFSSALDKTDNTLSLTTSFEGTSTSVRVRQLEISSADHSVQLSASGSAADWQYRIRWNADIQKLQMSEAGGRLFMNMFGTDASIMEKIGRLGNMAFKGTIGGAGDGIALKGQFNTDAGTASAAIGKNGRQFTGHLETDDFNIGKITGNDKFGFVATNIDIDGRLPDRGSPSLIINGNIPRFDYNGYTYEHIHVDGTYHDGFFDGLLNMDDPNARINLQGQINTKKSSSGANMTAEVRHLRPSALKMTDKWGNALFDFDITANIQGNHLNTANGQIDINGLTMHSAENNVTLNNLHIAAFNKGKEHQLTIGSDFGNIEIEGQYDYSSLSKSITNLILNKLPTIPGLPKQTSSPRNNFTVKANIDDTQWLRDMFGIPLILHSPVRLQAQMADSQHKLILDADLPHFTYNGKSYRNAVLRIDTPSDTLQAHASITQLSDNGGQLALALDANAANNHLKTSLHFDNHAKQQVKGKINTDAQFFKTSTGKDAAHVDIHSSEVTIGDSIWEIEPGTIVYSKNDLTIDHLAVKHGHQYIIVDGQTNTSSHDSLTVELKDIDVKYILDLVNFHSVDFSGYATGKAFLTQLFSKPEASAQLSVNQFRFQDGRMGTLTAEAHLNNDKQQIDIDAVAQDVGQTIIQGYVSPQRNEIELLIEARHSRGEFIESFCSSFMRDANVWIDGNLRLYGPLSSINLTGEAVVNGTMGIKSLNTVYTLRNDTIRLIPNEIVFERDTIYDVNEHIGIVNGSLHHQNLTKLTFDIGVQAQNLLSYDFREFGDDTFCGTVYGTGQCDIRGRSGEVTIDVNVTPEENSEIRYNVSSPDAISNGEFITWHSRTQQSEQEDPLQKTTEFPIRRQRAPAPQAKDIPTDIHLNFLINANPRATLKLIMDQESGDYIALNGNGVIRATYYNKGSFDMFGNYNVDHGIYKLTIQNVIKKDFQFQEGGSIVFGGDPYNAALNLKALYTVNGVPLSDLNIGRSFTSNNIRVNCIMNISGTPYQPVVDFSLDMPTVGTDAKQMIFSVINSEEEMNQQVIYLLAVGRFYHQGANNAGDGSVQQSQTSLAMQSLLSGTISQQLNNVLSSVVKNNNWDFGANISTGDQGFYNAEYEGLLSGRLLNNRLLINGEFGYRDNPNATTSFIGDFDIRYLLRPNGNIAIKVYNQTNDRYFTRNSLNTQGIGLLLKKDFNGISNLFGTRRKSAKKATTSEQKATEGSEKENDDQP